MGTLSYCYSIPNILFVVILQGTGSFSSRFSGIIINLLVFGSAGIQTIALDDLATDMISRSLYGPTCIGPVF